MNNQDQQLTTTLNEQECEKNQVEVYLVPLLFY